MIQSYHILIADTDETMRHFVSLALEQVYTNVYITTASNGQEALAIVNHQLLHLLIISYALPLLNGLDLISKVRTGQQSNIPIVFMSSYSELARHVSGYSATIFLAKPFTLAQLRTTVKTLLPP